MAPNRTTIDRILAEIWKETLALSAIQPDDDFFALGGTSRMAIQMVSSVRDAFDVDVPLALLANASCFRDFSDMVERALNAQPQ